MRFDPLFLLCGALALCAVLVSLGQSVLSGRPIALVAALLWSGLAAGLILQSFAPHLAIENNMFAVPERDASGRPINDPISLVEKDRRMLLWSAVLTSAAAIGLCVLYRDRVFQRHSRHLQDSRSERGVAKSR
jgi:hypothetical protein